MQPRYFIGIALPKELTERIEHMLQDLLVGHKVMEPLVPHITLLHPNILMTLAPLYFVPLVKAAADKLLPIDIELTKTALFDKRVLHIAVKSSGLMELHAKLIELLPDDVRARYEVGREFSPHITLAQAKPLQKLPDELIATIEKGINPLLPKKFQAKQLSQFTWQGPRKYKVASI